MKEKLRAEDLERHFEELHSRVQMDHLLKALNKYAKVIGRGRVRPHYLLRTAILSWLDGKEI